MLRGTLRILMAAWIANAGGRCRSAERLVTPIVRGEGYVISSFKGCIPDSARNEIVTDPGLAIVHINLVTGEVTPLISTGVSYFEGEHVQSPRRNVARVTGVDQNKDLFGVLTITGIQGAPSDGRGGGRGLEDGRYLVLLFSKRTGMRVSERIVRRPPEIGPWDSLSSDKFKMSDHGYIAFGTEYKISRIGDRTIVQPVQKREPPTQQQ